LQRRTTRPRPSEAAAAFDGKSGDSLAASPLDGADLAFNINGRQRGIVCLDVRPILFNRSRFAFFDRPGNFLFDFVEVDCVCRWLVGFMDYR